MDQNNLLLRDKVPHPAVSENSQYKVRAEKTAEVTKNSRIKLKMELKTMIVCLKTITSKNKPRL